MSSSSVWVQLYYQLGKNGSPEQIYESDLKPGRDWNIASLRGLVKDTMAEALTHCSANELVVFSPKTTPPSFQDNSFDPGDDVPTGTTSKNPLIVVAPTPPPTAQQPADPLVVAVTLKYSRNKTEIHPWRKDLTLELLRQSVMSTWSEFEVAAFRLKFDGAILLEEESDIGKVTFPATIVVENMRKGFSDFKEADAYKYAGITNQVIDACAFPTPFDIDVEDEPFQHAKTDLTIKHRLFGALTEGCEFTRREFISSVLVLAANVAEVQLGVEEPIAGRFGHGPVDWVALHKSYRICITEGKKDDLTKGVVQNIAQMVAAGEDRNPKRKFSPSIPMYGIATTYTEWVFLKLTCGEPRALFRWHDRTIDKDNIEVGLKQVAGQIVAIFKELKVAVDNGADSMSPAKRPNTRQSETILPQSHTG